MLIRDEAGRVQLVDPTYKDGWDLPGGMVEANESPMVAATRELREELGLTVPLACPAGVRVDHRRRRAPMRPDTWRRLQRAPIALRTGATDYHERTS